MESKTKHRILGIVVVAGLAVIAYPFIQGGSSASIEEAQIKAPGFPDQAIQLADDTTTTEIPIEPSSSLVNQSTSSTPDSVTPAQPTPDQLTPNQTPSSDEPQSATNPAQPGDGQSSPGQSDMQQQAPASSSGAATVPGSSPTVSAPAIAAPSATAPAAPTQPNAAPSAPIAAPSSADAEPAQSMTPEEPVTTLTSTPAVTNDEESAPAVKAVSAEAEAPKAKKVANHKQHKKSIHAAAKNAEPALLSKLTTASAIHANRHKPLDNNGLVQLKKAAWVIQMGSFKQKSNAIKLVNSLRAQGYRAFIQHAVVASGENTRVFVGPEQQQAAARIVATELETKMKLRGMVISYKPFNL